MLTKKSNIFLVGLLGLEPRSTDYESDVLNLLTKDPEFGASKGIRTPTFSLEDCNATINTILAITIRNTLSDSNRFTIDLSNASPPNA